MNISFIFCYPLETICRYFEPYHAPLQDCRQEKISVGTQDAEIDSNKYQPSVLGRNVLHMSQRIKIHYAENSVSSFSSLTMFIFLSFEFFYFVHKNVIVMSTFPRIWVLCSFYDLNLLAFPVFSDFLHCLWYLGALCMLLRESSQISCTGAVYRVSGFLVSLLLFPRSFHPR